MRPWVVIALAAGCNQIYGLDATTLVDAAPDADERPDIDQDGIADVEDPCLNSEADRVHDFDMDGVRDGSDGCLFFPGGADSDGDSIPDGCDPFDAQPGDRVRCTTTFQSRELSSAIWLPRMGESELFPGTGALIGIGDGTGVAPPGMLGNAPTITVDLGINIAYAQLPFTLGVWLSAQETPGSSDVGCLIVNNGMGVRLQLVGVTPVVTSLPGDVPRIDDASSEASLIGLRAFLQPAASGMNVSCYIAYTSSVTNAQEVLNVRGHIAAPLGRFGFVVRQGIAYLFGLTIFERNDTPVLP